MHTSIQLTSAYNFKEPTMFDIRLLLFVLLSRCYFLLMDSEPSHSAGGGSLRYLSLANLGDRILQSSLGMEKDREDAHKKIHFNRSIPLHRLHRLHSRCSQQSRNA